MQYRPILDHGIVLMLLSIHSLMFTNFRAAGPLMLSPTGQILAPSSCPPWLLVNFITENMEEAKKMIKDYERFVTQNFHHCDFLNPSIYQQYPDLFMIIIYILRPHPQASHCLL